MTEPTRPTAVRATGPSPHAPDEQLPAAFAPVSESDASGLRAIATMFAELGTQLQAPGSETYFAALTRVAATQIAGTRSASVTTLRAGKFRTEAATDDLSRRGDALQYELGSGPCIDAIVDSALYHTPSTCATTSAGPRSGGGSGASSGWPAWCPTASAGTSSPTR